MLESYRDFAVGVWSAVAPFVAAGLAAWFGYYFGVKRKQQELLVSDKFERVKKLHDAIVGLHNFCAVKISGGDLGLDEEGLPKDTLRSPLEHSQHLQQIFTDAMFFLSRRSRTRLQALIGSVRRAARMELRKAEAELRKAEGAALIDEERSAHDLYSSLYDEAESCIEMLHREAGSSRN